MPVTTLDAFCDARGIEPDWIVMDIEGYEFAALEGAQRVIARRGDRLHIVAEFHPSLWPLAGWSAQEGRRLLERLALSVAPVGPPRDVWQAHGTVHLRVGRT